MGRTHQVAARLYQCLDAHQRLSPYGHEGDSGNDKRRYLPPVHAFQMKPLPYTRQPVGHISRMMSKASRRVKRVQPGSGYTSTKWPATMNRHEVPALP